MSWHRISRTGVDVAVVGATGAVGEILIGLIERRRFPIRNLKLLASGRSQGSRVAFGSHLLPVEEATATALDGAQLVFFAATGELSRALAPEAVKRGAIVIDKSNTWRMDPAVPLVVPEVNEAALEGHRGIIACPNCTTIGLVMALEPLRREAGLEAVVATTFQAVSGAGRDGLIELEQQERALLAGERVEPGMFSRPIARNVLALCESLRPDGHSTEEYKLHAETRKILGLPELPVSCTAVRVPVRVGHSVAAWVRTERAIDAATARRVLGSFAGVRLCEDPEIPVPGDVADSDEVWVGRVRADFDGRGLWLWSVSNNLRKGAATNAIQIAEALLRRGAVTRGPLS